MNLADDPVLSVRHKSVPPAFNTTCLTPEQARARIGLDEIVERERAEA